MNKLHRYNRAFATGIGLNLVYVLIEAGYGFWVNSLALLADAGHNLSDIFSLMIGWGSILLAQKAVTSTRTFGFRRLTIFSALLSGIVLYIALGSIVWEAFQRLGHEHVESSMAIMVVAAIGVVVNGMTAWMFAKSRQDDLNMKGMFVHMMADTGVSIGVIVAGLTIGLTGWHWVDSVTSLFIVVVVLAETWTLTKQSWHLAVDGVPASIDMTQLSQALLKIEGVVSFHELHVWALSTTENAMTVHIITDQLSTYDEQLVAALQSLIQENYPITNVDYSSGAGDGYMSLSRKRPNADCILL